MEKDYEDIEWNELTPYHDIMSWEDVEKYKDAMLDKNGKWIGPPIVADGYQQLTGHHRAEAVSQIYREYGIEVEVPVVQLESIFFDEVGIAEYPYDEHINEHSSDYVALVNLLPDDILEKYGIDIH